MIKRLDWKAAIWAGVIAAVTFMVLEMLLVATVDTGSPWGPTRMMGAMFLGRDVLPPPATFNLGVFLVAMTIHFILAIFYGIILAWIISHWRMGLGKSIGAGAIFGLLIYLANFYGFTALFPWFADGRTPVTLISHVVFGLILGWAYHGLAIRHLAHHLSSREHTA